MGRSTGQVRGIVRCLAALCWAGLVLPLVVICHRGLLVFPAPGLADWWILPWIMAAALCAADSVLWVAFQATGKWVYLLAMGGLAAVTLGLEILNVEVGRGEKIGGVASLSSQVDLMEQEARAASLARGEREAMVEHLRATESVWKSDGDRKNDQDLAAAEKMLDRAIEREKISMEKFSALVAERADRQSAAHPVVREGWILFAVAGGLLVLKCVMVALASVVHGKAEEIEVAPVCGRGKAARGQGSLTALARRLF